MATSDGWGVRVSGSADEIEAAGASETAYGEWIIDTKYGMVSCVVRP
jgi:hypothetical protein